MAMYLTKFSHTPETWANLLAKPEDRRELLSRWLKLWAESCTATGMHSGTLTGSCSLGHPMMLRPELCS
jgi:hypothetical protein